MRVSWNDEWFKSVTLKEVQTVYAGHDAQVRKAAEEHWRKINKTKGGK